MTSKIMKPNMLKFFLALCFLFLIPLAQAGVGIKYGIESIAIPDESLHCVEYGVYNPWEDTSVVVLSAGGDIEQFALESTEVNVSAYTYHGDAITVDICFQPDIFEKDCLINDWGLCRKVCAQEEAVFEGEVAATEIRTISASGTGSAASASAAAPLKITVKCESYERNWLPVIALVIVIVITVAALLFVRQVRKPVTRAKKLKKYRKLQARLRRLKKEIK